MGPPPPHMIQAGEGIGVGLPQLDVCPGVTNEHQLASLSLSSPPSARALPPYPHLPHPPHSRPPGSSCYPGGGRVSWRIWWVPLPCFQPVGRVGSRHARCNPLGNTYVPLFAS